MKKKKGNKKNNFNENQKTFLTEKFNLGLTTGNKEDPENVARAMRVVNIILMVSEDLA